MQFSLDIPLRSSCISGGNAYIVIGEREESQTPRLHPLQDSRYPSPPPKKTGSSKKFKSWLLSWGHLYQIPLSCNLKVRCCGRPRKGTCCTRATLASTISMRTGPY